MYVLSIMGTFLVLFFFFFFSNPLAIVARASVAERAYTKQDTVAAGTNTVRYIRRLQQKGPCQLTHSILRLRKRD